MFTWQDDGFERTLLFNNVSDVTKDNTSGLFIVSLSPRAKYNITIQPTEYDRFMKELKAWVNR